VKPQLKSRLKALVATVLVLVLVPAAVALAVSGTYTGKTSQGKKCGGKNCTIALKVVKNVVQQGSGIVWRAQCSGKSTLTASTGVSGKLKNGKFHAHGSYRSALGQGVYSINTVTISFKVGAHKAPGTFTASAVVHQPSGAVVAHCHTGKVTFTAHK
jgi:hypothetical protein